LLTGAIGFIGRYVVPPLVKVRSVKCYVRKTSAISLSTVLSASIPSLSLNSLEILMATYPNGDIENPLGMCIYCSLFKDENKNLPNSF